MSVWIELRCSEQHEEHAAKLYTGRLDKRGLAETSECWSNSNDGCGRVSADATQKSVAAIYKEISEQACKLGWKRINSDWVCPHCAEYRGKSELNKVKPWC